MLRRYKILGQETAAVTGVMKLQFQLTLKDEAQTALFKDPVRTAL
jgi:hypothetical protein